MTAARAAERRRTPRPRVEARDQEATPFTPVLSDLVARVPGALAAALVDAEGETVDYAGDLPAFDVKIAAAHFRLLIGDVEARPGIGALRALVVRGQTRSFIACPLPEGYALVVLLRRRAGFAASSRALFACERALCREAGWELTGVVASGPDWCPVVVECDRRRRPTTVRAHGDAHHVEIIGSVMGLHAREIGFRVRVDTGAEVTLVREPGGWWYADDSVDPTKSNKRV